MASDTEKTKPYLRDSCSPDVHDASPSPGPSENHLMPSSLQPCRTGSDIQEFTLPDCESDSTEIPQNEGSHVAISIQDGYDINCPFSVGNDFSWPVVAANTSGANSLETIDDGTQPPTPLSLMAIYPEKNVKAHDNPLGMKDVVAKESNARKKDIDQGDNETNFRIARKTGRYSDPNIQEKRLTRFEAISAASAFSVGERNQKSIFKTETTTILEAHYSGALSIPTQSTERSPAARDVVDRSTENVWRENMQDESQQNKKSSLPPLEIRRTDSILSSNALFDKNSTVKGKNQTEVASDVPKLETHNLDSAPVPLHLLGVANDNEGLIYQQRLQEKSLNFEETKESILVVENAARNNASVDGACDFSGSFNIRQDEFDSIESFDIQHSIESNENSEFNQGSLYYSDTTEYGNDPVISNLPVAQPVYELDENNLPLNRAVEYDPSDKPLTRVNRKYFCITAVGLVVIGMVIAVSVLFGTKEAASQSELQNGRPYLLPTASPNSSRALSGIEEEIESNVLRRNATFQNMTAVDPRKLALEWILFDDERQLAVSDPNLHQRYILALLAFSLDSSAWTQCGGFDELETCTISPSNEVITVGNTPWLSGSNECEWYGVTCVVGIVRGLQLVNNNLIGEIVPEVAGLRNHIVVLDLSANCLYGTLPPEIGDLSLLELLKISSNSLSGTFPENLYKLSKLEQLDLANQYSNDRSCTRSDGTIVSLKYQVGNPKNLINYGIEGNILDGRIGSLNNLQTLTLENNGFYGRISSRIGNLKRLVHFNAARNFFSGSLPDELTEMRNLKELWIEQNSLTGEIPCEVGRMESLETFSVWQNPNMTGTIPDSLYNLTNLNLLIINTNNFSGTLSTKIGNLKRLSRLHLNDNNFSGTLPSELGLCKDLEYIRLQLNEFSGSVPEQVCALNAKGIFYDTLIYKFLVADCLPDNKTSLPRLQCDCCDMCCDGITELCLELD